MSDTNGSRGPDYVHDQVMHRYASDTAARKLRRDSSEDDMHPDIGDVEENARINEYINRQINIHKAAAAATQNPKDIAGSRKPPLHLVPPVANIHEAMVLNYGANSHPSGPRGEYNWRTGPKISHKQYIAAAIRHLSAINDGEDYDEDSELLHWAHVRATAGIVLDALSLGQLNEDRAAEGKAGELIRFYTLQDPTEVE